MIAAPAGRDTFADPATGLVYPWPRNHDEEQAGARVRTIDNSQPTLSRWRTVRAIRVQSPRDALVLKLAGRIPTRAQHAAFLHFMAVSLTQTIYFFHAAGEKYECLLSDYEPQRAYVQNEREDYLFVYTLQIDVILQF